MREEERDSANIRSLYLERSGAKGPKHQLTQGENRVKLQLSTERLYEI